MEHVSTGCPGDDIPLGYKTVWGGEAPIRLDTLLR